MHIQNIFTAPISGADMQRQDIILVEPGKGILGSRHYRAAGGLPPDRQITLIEHEAIATAQEQFPDLTPADTRRNLITRNTDLGKLVGSRFRIGRNSNVILYGIARCEPCAHLVDHLGKRDRMQAFLDAFLHTGLRAQIVQGGLIKRCDGIYPL